MRVIGRNRDGQMVGWFERHGGQMVGGRFDAGVRVLGQHAIAGFREAVSFLYGLGSVRFDVVA